MKGYLGDIKITCVWELSAPDEITAMQTVATQEERAHWPIGATWSCVSEEALKA